MTILDPELRELLHRIDELSPPAPPLPVRPRAGTTHRSTVRLAAIAASVLLVAAAVTAVVLSRRSSTSSIAPATTAASTPPSLNDLRAALGTNAWTLTAVDGTPTDVPFTLGVLAQGAIGGRIECNDYSLDETSPNDVARWTMMQSAVGCPGNNDALLSHVTLILVNTASISTEGNSLVIHDGKGHSLAFGRDTPTNLGDGHVVLPALLTHTAEGWVSSMEGVSGFYSNVPLGPSCSNGGCGWPIHALPPNSIVVAWGSISGPIATDQPQGMAPNTTIGGRAATKTTDLTEGCRSLGGTASVVVNISPEIKMRACMRGPDIAPLQADVEAMLRSVTFG
jgi:hypothetical protein